MRLRDTAVALAAVAVVVGLLRLASPIANTTTVALCLVVVVLAIARMLSGAAALVASVAAVLAFNFYFIHPFGTFAVDDPLNWVALLVFLAVAVTVGELSARAKRQTSEAVAQRVKAERLYQELQAAFDREAQTEGERRSERLKSALLDAVTHNLRTPITSIKASTTALLTEPTPMADDVRRELLTVVIEEADRLNVVVEDLIGLARIEAGDLGLQMAWCSIEDVIGGAIARVGRVLETHPIELSIPEDVPLVKADARSLEEVFFQLLENAARYSPPQSAIAISARNAGRAAIEVRVEDSGPGIDPAERTRIFDKFYRSRATETIANGAGLGLAIARGIVTAHRGDVWVTERDGQGGACFVVRLHVSDEGRS